MTEYDYSPGALERFKAKQQSVGRWAAHASSKSSQFSHPFPEYTSNTDSSHPRAPVRRSTMPPAAPSSSSTIRPSGNTIVASRLASPPPSMTSQSRPSLGRSTHSSTHVASSSGRSRHSRPASHHSSSRSSSHSHSHRSGSVSGSHHSSSSPRAAVSPVAPSRGISFHPSSVAPSDSISQTSQSRPAPRRSSTMPSPVPRGLGHPHAPTPYVHGTAKLTITRPTKTHGHIIIPPPGQAVDVYVVKR